MQVTERKTKKKDRNHTEQFVYYRTKQEYLSGQTEALLVAVKSYSQIKKCDQRNKIKQRRTMRSN